MKRTLISLLALAAMLPAAATTYFVKCDASDGTSGTTWPAAMNLQGFIDRLGSGAFADGDVVCFAGGVYRMPSAAPIVISGLDITLRGGYAPDLRMKETPELIYPTATPTLLTADVNLSGRPDEGDARNIFYIDNSAAPDAPRRVTVEGFTLTGCYYAGTNAYEAGAVVAELTRGVTLRHCTIEGNVCVNGGGAGFTASGSDVHAVDCILRHNEAGDAGAAIRAARRTTSSGTPVDPTVIVERCLIADNSLTAVPGTAGRPAETLYNGIVLPDTWPPKNMSPYSASPMNVPYLDPENIPAVIPINVGRQLFVDDFLVESVTDGVERRWNRPVKYSGNPILKAETELELANIPGASAKDGGVYWDQEAGVFKMWYEAGWLGTMAYAESRDGIRWTRPDLGVGKRNQILPGLVPNSCAVVKDYTAPAEARYKIYLRSPNANADKSTGYAAISPDGIHWNNITVTGPAGDRSTMFYNPFRRKYVFSLRNGGGLGPSPRGRNRFYRECSDFLSGALWAVKNAVYWCGADNLDEPDPEVGITPELYNVDAIAYESLMLGMHQIFLGPQNDECGRLGIPKRTDLKVAFSRDGFHWSRPDRQSFIPSSGAGAWDRGYVQCVGGICSVVGDQLRFYYIGFRGDDTRPGTSYGMHSHGATGMAVMRRDGFCAITAPASGGSLLTRPVTFDGRCLFVNADCGTGGSLTVDILDAEGNPLPGLTAADCEAVTGDSTIRRVSFRGTDDLSELAGTPVRFRFNLSGGAELYAFWVSPSEKGESRGYVAGGGPGYATDVDHEGTDAYREAQSYQLK